jgi:hypothetical protein
MVLPGYACSFGYACSSASYSHVLNRIRAAKAGEGGAGATDTY